MIEHASDRPNRAVESAFTEALVAVTAVESELDDFFECVQSEQLNRHTATLARYCDYAVMLFEDDEAPSQQAFIEGVVLGLWVADKMASHAQVESPEMADLLATNTAVPPEHRAIPSSPNAEHNVAHQLKIARTHLDDGYCLDAAEHLIRLSDIAPDCIDDARAGMIMAIGEASFAIEAASGSDSQDFIINTRHPDIELNPEEVVSWQTAVNELQQTPTDAEEVDPATEAADILRHLLGSSEATASMVSELAAGYQHTDPIIFDSILYQSRAVEPRDEDYVLIDENKRASIHFLDGAVIAMKALEVESELRNDEDSSWRHRDPVEFPGLGMSYQASDEGKYNIGAAIDHRGELFRQACEYYTHTPAAYRHLLLRIAAAEGYDSRHKYVLSMGFAYAYGHLSDPVSQEGN